jgi:uncharacterized protein YcnI
MLRKLSSLLIVFAVMAAPTLASAHVIVTPGTAGIATQKIFSISVVNEEQVSVSSIKLAIPAGITAVSPTVAAGWTITTEKTGNAVTSISWSGAEIPAGQRQDFTFSAQTPAKAGEVDWKAYQTYSDGTVIKWDQKPNGSSNDATGNVGPYSVTKVVNDLAPAATIPASSSNSNNLPVILSVAAIVIALGSVVLKK